MQPTLTGPGKAVLVCGLAFLCVGAVTKAMAILGLGASIVCALLTCYVVFFPTAVSMRQREVELSWWIPPGEQPGGSLVAERPFRLHLAIRNHSGLALRTSSIRVFASSGLEVPEDLEAEVPAGHQVEICADARSHGVGYMMLHGAVLSFVDRLGLCQFRSYFPNPLGLRVFPRTAGGGDTTTPLRLSGASEDRAGLHTRQTKGASGQLRELREHEPGDAFKFIAWKATARRQRLMVRELEREICVTQAILLDVSSTMRIGHIGTQPLDVGISLAARLAKSVLSGGDRAGLVTFDARVFSEVAPGDGAQQLLRINDRLSELRSIVDEDLTDITHGELVAAVARYLVQQEGIDVRVKRTPAIDDPTWQRLTAGPDGDLYDLHRTSRVVRRLLRAQARGETGRPSWAFQPPDIERESPEQMALLRLFCRVRCLRLPPMHHPAGRFRGLEDALDRSRRRGRPDATIVISDLVGLTQAAADFSRALRLASRGGHRVTVIAPVPVVTDANVAERALAVETRQRLALAASLIARAGARFVAKRANDPVVGLLQPTRRSR